MKINCAHLSLATPQHYNISLGCLCPNHVRGLGTSFQVSYHLSSLHRHDPQTPFGNHLVSGPSLPIDVLYFIFSVYSS